MTNKPIIQIENQNEMQDDVIINTIKFTTCYYKAPSSYDGRLGTLLELIARLSVRTALKRQEESLELSAPTAQSS